MSFLGIGARQPSSEEKVKAVESEMRLLADMLNRMTKACTIKCIGKDYREGELNKGEAVCLDRCAAKFFDTHMKISELMQKESQERGGGSPF